MDKFKIKPKKATPLHYHLMKVLFHKDIKRTGPLLKMGRSKFYQGDMSFYSIEKQISHLR